jgi:hypothetical protein
VEESWVLAELVSALRTVQKVLEYRGEYPIEESTMLKGSCHCQTVRFEIDEDMEGIFHCHCQTCQKLNGTSYGSTGFVSSDSFKIVAGADSLTAYESSQGKHRYFCANCGAPVYAQAQTNPDRIGVRVGLLDGDPGVRSKAHIWLSHEKPWFEVLTDLPKFNEFPD